MSRVSEIYYKGQKIIYSDFSNIKEIPEVKNAIEESTKIIRSQPQGSVLSLSNFSNMRFNTEIGKIFQDVAQGNGLYVKNSAMFGVSGLAKVVANTVVRLTGRNIKFFNTEEQAKEYLVDNSN